MTDSHSMVLMPNCQRKLRSTLASRATNLASRAVVDLGEDVADGQFTGVRPVPFLARGDIPLTPSGTKRARPSRQTGNSSGIAQMFPVYHTGVSKR